MSLPSIRDVFPEHFPPASTNSNTPKTGEHHSSQLSRNTLPSAEGLETDDPTRRYPCELCGKRFSKPSGLQVHVNSHTGFKPFRCEESGCSRKFSSNFNLQRHKERLHGVKHGGRDSP